MANAEPYAYISNSEDGTVSVIDLAADAVVKTIPVGDRPIGVAVTRDGAKVYVTSLHDKSITVIDGRNHAVLATKPVDMTPMTVAVNAAQSRVYVVGNGIGDESPSRIVPGPTLLMVLDASTLEPLAQVPLNGKDVAHVAVSPDDTQVWVQVGKYEVAVVDAASNSLSQRINVQAGSISPLVFGAKPSMVYVGGRSNLITVDISSNPPSVQNIHMMAGGETHGLALSAAGDRAYVAKDGVGLDIYDLKKGERLAFVKTGEHPGGVAVHPDGSRIYVVNPTENAVAVVDAETFNFLGNIGVGKNPIVFGQFIQPAPPRTQGNVSTGKMTLGKVIALSLLGAFLMFVGIQYFRTR